MRPPPAVWLPGLGLLIAVGFVGVAALGDLRDQLVAFVALFLATFGVYLAAIRLK